MQFNVKYDESNTKKIQRNKILSESFRLFIDNGIQNVTMQDIAEASSIQRRTLYHYYGSKEAVAIELINSVLGEFKNNMPQIPDYLASSYARIEYFLHLFVEYSLKNEDVILYSIQFDYFFHKGPPNDETGIISVYGELEHLFLSEIQRGIDDGSIKQQYAENIKEVFFVIISSIFSLIQRILFREDIIRDEAGFDRKSISLLVNLLLSSLKA